MDSDDLLTKTALEDLTALAEKHNADVVHMQNFFVLWGGVEKSVDDPEFTDFAELTNPANFPKINNSKFRPDKPTFETNDLAERVRKYLAGGYAGYVYSAFYRRDFLVNNQIYFDNVFVHADQIFSFHAMCLAEKILRVPNIVYIVRPRKGSVMREQVNIEENIHKGLRICIDGFNAFKKIMDDIKFFDEHPDYRYAVLDWYVQTKLGRLQNFYTQIHPAALNPFVEREFSSDEASFAAYLFNTMNIQLLRLIQLQHENNALKEALAQK